MDIQRGEKPQAGDAGRLASGHGGEKGLMARLKQPLDLGAEGRSWTRASSALRCLPFRRAFYELVGERAISSAELYRREDWRELCFLPMGPDRIEAHFIWLIRLGVLRREVDGQGLTERVRLTPLGRQLLQQWPAELPRASLSERIHQNFRRHRPRL